MIPNEEIQEKRGLRASDFVLILLAILGILNTLMIDRAKIPDWYLFFSIGLIAVATGVFLMSHFGSSLDDRLGYWRNERERNKIAKEYFREFRDLVCNSKKFSYFIRDILNGFRKHYESKITSLSMYVLQSFNQPKIENHLYDVERQIDESKKTFRDLSLIMKNFKFVLGIYEEYLKIIEQFVHGITVATKKSIAKGYEHDFEGFREKYNDFLKDFNDYCHKLNQETESHEFPEGAFDYIKKW